MIFEAMTLVVLAAALLAKYITATHIAKLNQRELELYNECQEHQGRQKALIEERKVVEDAERDLRVKMAKLQINLDELQGELTDQEERNRELQDRITD